MKRDLVVAVVLLLVGLASAASPPSDKKNDNTRLLTGRVIDHQDSALPNAVVYLTNTHTRAVKTYIVGPDGAFRFPALQPTLDYEVYAQFNNRKSSTKSVSQFDDRSEVYISLKVNAKAEDH